MSSPEDKAAAREALERGRLTIEQVEAVLREAEATGRPFAEIAAPRRAPLPPAFYLALLGLSCVLVASLLAVTLLLAGERSRRDRERAAESAQMTIDAERLAGEAAQEYARRSDEARAGAARAALEKGRAALARAERAPDDPAILAEAAAGYAGYLAIFPSDAGALAERARLHELRRDFGRAIEDLERALRERPDLEPELKPRLDRLRAAK